MHSFSSSPSQSGSYAPLYHADYVYSSLCSFAGHQRSRGPVSHWQSSVRTMIAVSFLGARGYIGGACDLGSHPLGEKPTECSKLVRSSVLSTGLEPQDTVCHRARVLAEVIERVAVLCPHVHGSFTDVHSLGLVEQRLGCRGYHHRGLLRLSRSAFSNACRPAEVHRGGWPAECPVHAHKRRGDTTRFIVFQDVQPRGRIMSPSPLSLDFGCVADGPMLQL